MGDRAHRPSENLSSQSSGAPPSLADRAEANRAYLDALLPTLGEMNQVARALGDTVDEQSQRLDSIQTKEDECAESMKLLNRKMNRMNGGRRDKPEFQGVYALVETSTCRFLAVDGQKVVLGPTQMMDKCKFKLYTRTKGVVMGLCSCVSDSWLGLNHFGFVMARGRAFNAWVRARAG